MRYRYTSRLAFLTASLAVAGCNKKEEQAEARTEAAVPIPGPESTEPTDELSDAEIKAAVERELRRDPVIPSATVEVETKLGIVALEGKVPHLLAKERARRIAGLIKGVRAVSDRLEVDTPERADEQIEADIKYALLADPAADSYEVEVHVEDQRAKLTGKVQSWHEKQIVTKVASTVLGVAGVDNELDIEYGADRRDAEIQAEVQERLHWDLLVDAGPIRVTVDDGNVTLSGVVGSVAERARAVSDAWVTGVEDVRVDLDLQWWAKDEAIRSFPYQHRPDEEIEKALKMAAALDPRVYSFNIEPEIEYGVVTLRGTVSTIAAKQAAESLARNTVGVSVVHNELKVESDTPVADSALERAIAQLLRLNPITERYEIDVDAREGVVTLAGKVDNEAERAEAESVANSVVGVTSVDNELEVEHDVEFAPNPFVFPYHPVTPWSGSWRIHAMRR